MKLSEILELKYTNKNKDKNSIEDVYGIIYRIYCIPEDKSYVGQTCSHTKIGEYICKTGLLKRIKTHWTDRTNEYKKDNNFAKILCKYEVNDFEVFEETRLYGKEIGKINLMEKEYIKKYNCIYPNGYNTKEFGSNNNKMLKILGEHYSFEVEKGDYVDTTRDTRCKDVTVGTYFNMSKNEINKDIVLEKLKNVNIEKIRLTDSNGLRILVKVKDENINIRIYFSGSEEECLEYAKKISDKIETSEAFRQCYKYQCKIEKVIELSELIEKVSGKMYQDKTGKKKYVSTFLLW